MGGDGAGGFLSVDSREGTEISLGGSGWKPLMNAVPDGARGFAVDPLCDPRWDYFTFSGLAYRGHDVAVSWRRGRTGLTVTLDGREVAHSPDLARLYIPLDGLMPCPCSSPLR